MEYKKLVKQLRTKLILTQEEFAKLLGASTVSIIRWEAGTFEPTMKMKRKIMELCKQHKIVKED